MLAKVYKDSLYQKGMFVQPKLNGVRMMARGEYLVSRGSGNEQGEVWQPNRLTYIRMALEYLREDIIWDGELYCHGMSLQEINKRASVTSAKIHIDEGALEYHIFDYVSREPAYQRIAYLSRVARTLQGRFVKIVPSFYTSSALDASRHYERFKSQGYEGMMYRTGHMPYAIPGEHSRKDNRVGWLLKRKDWLDLDATIIGLDEGEGKCAETLGSFRLQYGDKTFSAGSGPTDAERAEYWKLGPRLLGCLCKVKYEMLSDEGVPLKPIVIQVELPK